MSERRDGRLDLVTGFIEGKLDDDQRERLLRDVQGDGRVLDQIGRQALMHGLLGAAGSKPLDPDAVLARLDEGGTAVERAVMGYVGAHAPAPARSRWRPRAWLAGLGWITAAATAAWFLWLRPPRPAPPPVADGTAEAPAQQPEPPRAPLAASPDARPWAVITSAARGVFAIDGAQPHPAQPGMRLHAGDGVVTAGADGRAILLLGDGTRVDVDPDTVIARGAPPGAGEAGAGSLLLARGVLQVLRAPASTAPLGELRIETPHGRVLLASARARVQVGGEGTRLDVNAGRARLVGPGRGGAAEIAAGQYALTAGDGAVTRGSRGARRALLLAGARTLHPADAAIRARLEKLGFEVTSATTATLDPSAAADTTVLVISSSVSPQDVDARVRDLPVPILTWEVGLYPVLGMTGRCEDGECGFHMVAPFALEIRDRAHPLAAGLSGTVPLAHTEKIGWGTPNIHAAWVATIAGHPTRAAIFAYELGAQMPGLAAPARRVGFFFHDTTAENLPASDPQWLLFDRAALWCLE